MVGSGILRVIWHSLTDSAGEMVGSATSAVSPGRRGPQAGESAEIAEVMLDRPVAMNALNTAILTELAATFAALGADDSIRAVVLSAAGERAFCVGADLKERAAMSDAEIMAQRPVFRAAFGALLALAQPVIAAVHGFALGGGCELAL